MNNALRPDEELKREAKLYRHLFEKMAIDGDYSHGYTWSLGSANSPREIRFSDGRQIPLSPADTAVISIGLSLGDDTDPLVKISNTGLMKSIGIINEDNCLDLFYSLLSRVRGEHLTHGFFSSIAENQGKIIPLLTAYKVLITKKEKNGLNAMEHILLGYVLSILSYRYEMRMYMIDERLKHTISIVEVYDEMFDNFSEANYNLYFEEGYKDFWELFLSIREEIAKLKGMPLLTSKIHSLATGSFRALMERLREYANLIDKITRSPPSASNHQQDQQSP